MVIFVIIGALIGAGFASGQEINLFFYKYGKWGILGLIICSILVGIVIYKTFRIVCKRNIKNYKEFLDCIFRINDKSLNGKNKRKYFNLSYINNIIVNIFLLVTFYIMIAGFGTYFYQEFNISSFIGAIILAGVCFIVFLKDIQGVVKANSIVVPVLIICIIIIGVKSFIETPWTTLYGNFQNFEINKFNGLQAIWESIIYCSYNMILLLPVLINLRNYIKDKKQIMKISIISGSIILVLAICIFTLLVSSNIRDFSEIEMPAVYCISTTFSQFRGIYGIVILLSIFTTAISVGMGFLENVSKNNKSYTQFASVLCITSVLISNFGFSNLVKIMFPVFGYLGIMQICFLMTKNNRG